MPRIGLITGTRREAACLGQRSGTGPFDIACSGADAARARECVDSFIAAGCDALLSFGVAGGLDPALAAGIVVVADAVVTPAGVAIETDTAWRDVLTAGLRSADIPFATGAILGVDRPVTEAEPKRLLFSDTGALVVDMESHMAAQAAQRRGVPVLAVRAVADTATDEMPAIAMTAIGTLGRVRYGALAAALLRRPGDIVRLVRLARLSRPAFASLRRVAALPGLGGAF